MRIVIIALALLVTVGGSHRQVAVAGTADTSPTSVRKADSPSANTSAVGQPISASCQNCPIALRQDDQLWLVSCRKLGCSNPSVQVGQLQYWQYVPALGWQLSNRDLFFASVAPEVTTTFYVHGNRVDNTEARRIALTVYRSVAASAPPSEPMQFVLWSWPSERIAGGQLEDVRVKAQRTGPAGYYLAWVVSQLPREARMTLIGYSFGARIVTGSLHALGGGRLAGSVLPTYPKRSTPVGAVLIAAAVNDDWLRPGMPHERATSQIDRLLLVNNSVDSALRHYHLLYGLRRTAVAMGAYGPAGYAAGGFVYEEFDAGCIVGKEHNWELYFGSPSIVRRLQPTVFARTKIELEKPSQSTALQ